MARDEAYRKAEQKIEEARRSGAKELDLIGMDLTELPESLGQLTQLQKLNVHSNQLTALPESLGQLTQLKSLELHGNRLSALPEQLGGLTKVKVLRLGDSTLGENFFGMLPGCIRGMAQLEELYASRCQLEVVPEWIGEFRFLKNLWLIKNAIQDVPSSVARIADLKNLKLDDNPLNPELAAAYEEGFDAVKRYLRAKAEAQVVLNEAKLILIGEGEVGKSCLLGALRGDPWEEGRPTTHGIEIKPVKVSDPATGTEITLNGWDFGGQRVYRPTHQLFFSAPAVYLVVWKPREGPQQGFVKEWIKLVKHREPEANILVVATHGGPKERQPDIDRQEIWDLFGKETVLNFFFVESRPPNYDEKTKTWVGERAGIKDLMDAIARVAARLPEVGRSVPKRWEETRQALKENGAAYLPLEKVLKLCTERKMDEEEAKDFIRVAHRLGHLIHYAHDPALRDIVVLKPDWLSTAMSYVLDDKQTRDSHGLVEFARLGELWNDPARPSESRYDASLHPLFLRLMERFDLSYKVAVPAEPEDALGFWQRVGNLFGSAKTPPSGLHYTSLIAQLVPDLRPSEPELGAVWPANLPDGDGQQVQICRIVETKNGQSAAAEGLFYQLIVRLHKYSLGRADYKESVHWQRGLVLDDDYNGRALLEHTGNDVRITVRAAYPEAFLAVLTREVKWLVESFWAGLRCDVMVPCVEPCGRNTPGTGLYEVQKLIESKRRRRPEYPCPVCNEWQDIDCLLRNAPAPRTLAESDLQEDLQVVRSTRKRLAAPGPHAFLSYVSQDAEIIQRLVDDLTSHGIKVWFDRNDLKAGQRWKNAIRTAIREGGFFIACFSQEYSRRTTTYMNEELTVAIEELRRRRASVSWFIPVKLNDCSIPDRDIGSGETLQDIQHVALYENWSRGINLLAEAIQPVIQTQRAEPRPEAKKEIDPVTQAFSEAGLSPFSLLNSNLQRLLSRVDYTYANLMQTLADEAKEGPRLFSFMPVDPGFFDRRSWSNQKFRLTLWCEHCRLPLPALNGQGSTAGVYELNLAREWFENAAPFLKVLTGTLSLVLPVAASATKFVMDDNAYKGMEKELDLGQKSLDSVLEGGEKSGAWLGRSDAPDLERGDAIRAQGAVLRQLHAWLKEKDPSFGGLVRVQNKRQEFLWVHPQFEKEY